MGGPSLLERLGMRWPIVQAPMAGVSTPAMAAAVSNEGGLGSIGIGPLDAAEARLMIDAVRAKTRAAFNVNVFCHRPARANPAVERAWIERLRPEFRRQGAEPPARLSERARSFLENDEMLAMLLQTRPAVVSFHFGLPSAERIAALRAAGIVLFGTATNSVEAATLEHAGLDAIVAQGWEAGGHRGVFDPDAPDERLDTTALVRLLVAERRLPIIAAGGIMDGVGIGAMLRVGAVAAQLGTAFVATIESQADAGYRAAITSDDARHTVMTRAISGRPARCLVNRFTMLGESVSAAELPDYPIAYDAAKALHAAAKQHDEFGYGAQWAGEGAPRVRVRSTSALMAELIDELRVVA